LEFGKNQKILIGVIAVIIIVLAAGFLGYIDIPGISGGKPAKMLVLGAPALETVEVLDNSKDIVDYRIIEDTAGFATNAEEKIKEYDLIMLDQSNSPTRALPSTLAESIEGFVRKGGMLIVVKNSGIHSIEAPEKVGWKANFTAEVMPVECFMAGEIPSCEEQVYLSAEIERADFSHPIMMGIEKVPATPDQPFLNLQIHPITKTGNEIATIKDTQTTKYYPGIVEKRNLLGKVVYFNYTPGYTPGIFRNTLNYLK